MGGISYNEKKNAIVYGCGDTGRHAIRYISTQFNVMFFVDSDNRLWGSYYCGYEIKQPTILDGYEGVVVIATSIDYRNAIIERIEGEGINERNIFFYIKQRSGVEEVLPINCTMINSDTATCEKHGKSQVMLLCDFYSSYPIQLIESIKKRKSDISIDIISGFSDYNDKLSEYCDHIYSYNSYHELYRILLALNRYDVIHGLWIENTWAYFAQILREKCKKLVMNVGGSDLYRASKAELIYKKQIIDCADFIAVESSDVREDFLKIYPECVNKIKCLKYGLKPLDYLIQNDYKREKICDEFGFPYKKILLMCGHNALEVHQHIRVLDALSIVRSDIKESLFIVFPMTYPDDKKDYIEKVREYAYGCGLHFMIIDHYLSDEDVAKLDFVSDIMVHVQTTDSFSSSMLERMYTGCVVINGGWLPYSELEKRGIAFWKISSISELTKMIEEVAENYPVYKQKCQENKRIIYEMSSWDVTYKDWLNMWR